MRNFSFSPSESEQRLLSFAAGGGPEKAEPLPPTIDTKAQTIEVSDKDGVGAQAKKEVASTTRAINQKKQVFVAMSGPDLSGNIDNSPTQKGRVRSAINTVRDALRPKQGIASQRTPVQNDRPSAAQKPDIVQRSNDPVQNSVQETPKVDIDIGSQGVVKEQALAILAKLAKGEGVQPELDFLNGTLLPQVMEEGHPPREGWHADVQRPEGTSRLLYWKGKFVVENPRELISDATNAVLQKIEKGEDSQANLTYLNKIISQGGAEVLGLKEGWSREIPAKDGTTTLRYNTGKFTIEFVSTKEKAEKQRTALTEKAEKEFANFQESKENGTLRLDQVRRVFNTLDELIPLLVKSGDGATNGPTSVRYLESVRRQNEVSAELSKMEGKNQANEDADKRMTDLTNKAVEAMASYRKMEGTKTLSRSAVDRSVAALEALADELVTGPNAQRNMGSILFSQTDRTLKEVLAKRDEMEVKNETERIADEELAALSTKADEAMATYREKGGNGTLSRATVDKTVEALEALLDKIVTGPNAQRTFKSVLSTEADASLKEVLAKRDQMVANDEAEKKADEELAALSDKADAAFSTVNENKANGTLTRTEAEEAFNALDALYGELSNRGDGNPNSQSVLFKETVDKQNAVSTALAGLDKKEIAEKELPERTKTAEEAVAKFQTTKTNENASEAVNAMNALLQILADSGQGEATNETYQNAVKNQNEITQWLAQN